MKKTVMSITLALVLVVIGSLLLGKVIKSGIEENDSGSGSVSGGSVDDINGVVDNDDVHPGDEYDYSSLLALDIDGAVECENLCCRRFKIVV